jgi:uncharacterized protein CbrC (UPF0167 family)
VYTGVPYSERDLEVVCPWCIVDGTAHDNLLRSSWIDNSSAAGTVEPWPLTLPMKLHSAHQDFLAGQQERWFMHCSDAAEFLGAMGKAEIEQLGTDAVEAIRRESGYASDEWVHFYRSLDAKNGPSTAYLFRCRHYGTIGYSDCN